MDSVTALWHLYQQVEFLLSQPLSASVNFAIVTAYNPAGEPCSAACNRHLDQRLQASIYALGCPYREIIGASPDLRHQEKSWALLMGREEAIRLARRYRQNAIYWVEQDRLWLVPVLLASEVNAVALGSFRQRLKVNGLIRQGG